MGASPEGSALGVPVELVADVAAVVDVVDVVGVVAGVVAIVVVVPVGINPLAEGRVVVVTEGAGVVAGVVTTSRDRIARGIPDKGRVVVTGAKVEGVRGVDGVRVVEGVTVVIRSEVGDRVTADPLAG
jgi:hypothetical protein